MAFVYVRAGTSKYWARWIDEHGIKVSRPTEFRVSDPEGEAKALRYAKHMEKLAARKREATNGNAVPDTVTTYAKKWIKRREELGVRSVGDEEARLRDHVLPRIGQLPLADVRPLHVRDMIRELRKGDLAPRSIRHVYATVRTMFGEAETDELIPSNPCKLKRQDLPKKVDADPTWRAEATYTVREVERLIGDPGLPAERRVMYALKALAGLRHGEAAALRWRAYDATLKPLGRILVAESYDSKAGEIKATKTEIPRKVPVHPVLAKVLAEWKLTHWHRLYGRAPKSDDFIVPTRTMKCVNGTDAARAMLADLKTLGLRVEAGKERSRGGHDLRGWFITTAQEHGAHRDLLHVITHTAPGDVFSGYTRASWDSLCAEVAKLKLSLSDGEILRLDDSRVTVDRSARKRWLNLATPAGFEPASLA